MNWDVYKNNAVLNSIILILNIYRLSLTQAFIVHIQTHEQ